MKFFSPGNRELQISKVTQSPLYSYHLFKHLFHTLLYKAFKCCRVMRGEGIMHKWGDHLITYSHDQQQFNVRELIKHWYIFSNQTDVNRDCFLSPDNGNTGEPVLWRLVINTLRLFSLKAKDQTWFVFSCSFIGNFSRVLLKIVGRTH